MLGELQRDGCLDQEAAAYALEKQDAALVYMNDSGGIGIAKNVLAAFNKLAPTAD